MWAPQKAVLYARGNELVAGFRGTNVLDADDLACDAALVAGSEDARARFQNARRWVVGLALRYRTARLVLAGHSLGGSICLATLYRAPGVAHAHCYNAFASPTMISRSHTLRPLANYTRALLHLIIEDPISTDSLLMGQVTLDTRVKLGSWDPHALDNWL
jgi:pimeloyl-ACP methyl ester carboxylesterase